MGVWQGRSKRKKTGGRKRPHRKRRKYELGSVWMETKIGSVKTKVERGRGAKRKHRLVAVKYGNITNSETGETKKAEIMSVVENPANPHYVRRNIITKGAIIETELGRAKVTSRPSQHGIVNAILLREKS